MNEAIELPPECPCGAPWVRLGADIVEKTGGYFSPYGHDHDDNCMTRRLYCAAGCKTVIGIRRTCTVCDWKGKTACCSRYLYLDAWPVLPS